MNHYGTKLVLTALLLATAGPAAAAPRPVKREVKLTLTPARLAGRSGETLTLKGTLQNRLGQRVHLSGAHLEVKGHALKGSDTIFLKRAPQILGSGQGRKNLPVAELEVLLTADPGTYTGKVTVLGGARKGDRDPLAQATFSVVVR